MNSFCLIELFKISLYRRGEAGLFSELWRKGKFQETESIFAEEDCGDSSIRGTCSLSFASAASDPVAVLNEDQARTPTTIIKKQKKHGSVLSSPERSTEVIYLSSCGESMAETSTKDHTCHSQRVVGSRSPVAVGELSSEVRESNSETEARAIQVQLDEMLARELQEQLYNEMPQAATGEVSPPPPAVIFSREPVCVCLILFLLDSELQFVEVTTFHFFCSLMFA